MRDQEESDRPSIPRSQLSPEVLSAENFSLALILFPSITIVATY